jgi:hypothetical protein
MITDIIAICLALSPLIIMFIVIGNLEKKRDKIVRVYLEKNKCKICGKRKNVEMPIVRLGQFEVFCGNESCKNYGRRSEILYVDELEEEENVGR